MPLTFAHIPDHDRPPVDGSEGGPASGSAAPARSTALRDVPVRARRRTVLRAVALGALTLGAAALDWSGRFGTRAARAESSPYGLLGWDRNDCRDAYPTGYAETPDTGGDFKNSYAACFGGSWIGSNYCEAGWHRYGTYWSGDVRADHVPISSECGTTVMKHAWKWTTPDGTVYRCSDGFTTYWGGGYSGQTYLTICRAVV